MDAGAEVSLKLQGMGGMGMVYYDSSRCNIICSCRTSIAGKLNSEGTCQLKYMCVSDVLSHAYVRLGVHRRVSVSSSVTCMCAGDLSYANGFQVGCNEGVGPCCLLLVLVAHHLQLLFVCLRVRLNMQSATA